ncbi:MAG: DUF2085 domain-containing protein [Pyrinomonadaceae bacterium]
MNFTFIYEAAMTAGHLVCHQISERSPHVLGVQFPLCWRCTGILVGSLILVVYLLLRKHLPLFRLSLVLALLMPLDVLYNMIAHSSGDNGRRLVTGLLWGIFGTSVLLFLIERIYRRFNRLRLWPHHINEHGKE